LKRHVKACTEITHSDPKAYYAALAVAIAAGDGASDIARAGTSWPQDYLEKLKVFMPEDDAREFHELAKRAARSAVNDEPVAAFAEEIGSKNGISGYSYHTVPFVLQVWFRRGDVFEQGLQEIIRAGGDTDTAGAIFGGIVGAGVGKAGIPERWLSNILEWPRTIRWMERLGSATAEATGEQASNLPCPRYFVPGVLLRNLVFLVIVLAHGLRRLLPPY
jgi:ADP-ribosylglycohydrolase